MLLSHHLAPGLDDRERGAPAEVHLGVLTEPAQLLRAHERQQSWFQTDAELQGQPQVWMSWREGYHLSPYLALDAEAA